MAYNKKYYLPFKDFKNQSWELELAKEEYSGPSYKLIGAGDPVIMNDPNNGQGKFTPIKGSKLDMNFLVSPAIKEMFRQDFGNITDREWRAILKKTVGDSLYRGSVSIDNLNIVNTSTDAKARIRITNPGGISNDSYCYIEFLVPPQFYGTLRLVAVPDTVGGYNPVGIELAKITIEVGDSKQDVIDKIILANPKFSQEVPQYGYGWIRLKYTETDYNPMIDTNFQIKAGAIIAIPAHYYYFSAPTVRQFVEINFVIANEIPSKTPFVINIARHLYEDGEYPEDVAVDLANQIKNFGTIPSVYFPDYDEHYDVSFDTYLIPPGFDIILKNLGEVGNIPIRQESEYTLSRPNDTFIEIRASSGADYSWTKENFSGGNSGGDLIKIVVDKGTGIFYDIGKTIAYETDTAETIIQRLVDDINNRTSNFSAYVDITNTSMLHFETSENATEWLYGVIKSGIGTVTPSSPTLFDGVGGSINKWVGWVIPGIYKEQRTSGFVEINMTAIDGLGDLKNIEFVGDNVKGFELQSLLNIAANALQKTGLNFDIYEAFDLYELNTTTDKSPLAQIYQDTSRLNGLSCYEVLKEICILTKSELLQKNGHWEFRPKDRLIENFQYRTFSSYGVSKEAAGKTFNIVDVGGKNYQNILLNNNAYIEYANVFRQISIKQSYGFVDQLLKFPAFQGIDLYLIEDNPNQKYPWQLLLNGIIQASFLSKVYKEDDYTILASDYGQGNKFYLGQTFQIGDIIQGDTKDNQFELSIRYLGSKDDGTIASDFNIQLIVTDGVTKRWLNESEEFGYVWETTETSMLINCSENAGDQTFSLKFDYPSLEFTTDELKAELRIYQPDNRRIKLKSAEVKINAYAKTGVRNYSYHQQNVNELTYQVYDQEINLGDVPQLINAKQLYKNALYWIDGEGNNHLTELWDTNPSSPVNPKRLLDHVRHFYLSEYAKTPAGVSADRMGPPIILSADIYGTLELRDIIRVKTIDDKLFTLTGGQWNIKRCLVSGEWEQINLDTSGLTVIDEEKSFAESSSGKNSYTTISGREETTQVDLSNYLTQDQINALILGKTGTFLGSAVTNRQITIYHNLGYEPTYVVLLKAGKQLNPANFTFDTEESTDHIIITLSVPFQSTDTFKYRIL